jgi:hypothetical protein
MVANDADGADANAAFRFGKAGMMIQRTNDRALPNRGGSTHTTLLLPPGHRHGDGRSIRDITAGPRPRSHKPRGTIWLLVHAM